MFEERTAVSSDALEYLSLITVVSCLFYFIFNLTCQYLWSLMIEMISAFGRSLLVSKDFLCLPFALCFFLLCLKHF